MNLWFMVKCSLAARYNITKKHKVEEPPAEPKVYTTCSSETLELVYQNTECHIPEDSNLYIHCRGNLKSYIWMYYTSLRT
jgi:hypothetical protein